MTVPPGHVMSSVDLPMSAPPQTVQGPFTTAQRDAMLRGRSGGTHLGPHHRHQLPTGSGGVIDEIPGHGHPSGNQHTTGQRHPSGSIFNNTPGGNTQRAAEIREHWREKGARLVEVSPGVWYEL